jgi:hypothetical protein
LKVVDRYAAQAEDGAFLDGYSWTHYRARREPGLGLDSDRPDYQVEVGPAPVMIARAQVNPLGQAAMIANLNLSQIVYPDVLTDPRVIANSQAPRELDTDAGLNGHLPADPGAKSPQQPNA